MGLNVKSALMIFIIFHSYLSPIVAANAKLKFTQPNEIELLRRVKAADIKSWMNATVDPCHDFYNYACGNWARINAAQVQQLGSVSKYDVYNSAMEKRVERFIKDLKSGDVSQTKIFDYLQSCKNIKKNPQKYITDLKALLREEFGKFSYLKNADQEKATKHFNWWSTVAKIYSIYDADFIINIDVDYDLKSRNRTKVYIGQPTNREYRTIENLVVSRFKDYLNASSEAAGQLANDVYRFSEAIRKAGLDNTKSGLSIEEQFSLQNVTDFQKHYRGLFDIETYLKTALNVTDVPEEIYLETGGYFDDLIDIFNNTKPETVEHYILYWLVQKVFVDLDYSDIDYLCKFEVNWYFGKYIQHYIYEQFRSKEFERQIYELWNDIKSVFQDDLKADKYQWISKASREHAINKLNNIEFKISSYDDEKFETFFQTLPIDPSNYAHNVHNTLKHFKAWRGVKLELRTETLEDVAIAAYTPIFMPTRNEIRIPVSFLQPFHIWHSSYPKAILYAHIGSPVAHEMIHAFDDSGRHFDADGNANNWWDENAGKEFEIRRRCFQAQYHNYTFAGHRLPDLPAQGENIADNAAVKIAYLSYIRWLEKSKSKGNHLGEQFQNWSHISGEELFFISFGQYRCQGLDENLIGQTITDDVHAPHSLRVVGPLSNFPLFSQVFRCNRESVMNPAKRCEIF